MDPLKVFLFGRFDLRCGQRALLSLEAYKLQELLGYLLLYRDRLHPREVLASLLWGDTPTAKSKKHLRQAVWQLQSTLKPCAEGADGSLLLVEPDWIGINPRADYWLDVAAFERIYALVQETPGAELDAEQVEAVQAAVCIYRGDLLETCYKDWCLFERERLQNLYLALLDKLMAYHEAHREYETSLTYGFCILRHDPASERTHRRLMRLHYRARNRTAALRQYQRCAAALEQELGVKPGRRTAELYRQIRADELRTSTATSAQGALSSEEITSLSQAFRRFEQLGAALSGLYQQVERDMHTIEHALNNRFWPQTR